jgi:hypothetical protein
MLWSLLVGILLVWSILWLDDQLNLKWFLLGVLTVTVVGLYYFVMDRLGRRLFPSDTTVEGSGDKQTSLQVGPRWKRFRYTAAEVALLGALVGFLTGALLGELLLSLLTGIGVAVLGEIVLAIVWVAWRRDLANHGITW